MFEDILSYLVSTSPPVLIYLLLFFLAFIENVFPPSPSDLGVLIGGSLIAVGTINFFLALTFTTIGSIIGFTLMFYIGSTVDRKIIHSGKYKFLPLEAINKTELWFRKYGYFVVVANRFLPGTRAVISFFAGVSNLNFKKTVVLCSLSALTWNAIVLYLGYLFGDNVEMIDDYFTQYSWPIILITFLILVFFIIRMIFRKRKDRA
jgi:membrane protein DedA with SNARE-associated domain